MYLFCRYAAATSWWKQIERLTVLILIGKCCYAKNKIPGGCFWDECSLEKYVLVSFTLRYMTLASMSALDLDPYSFKTDGVHRFPWNLVFFRSLEMLGFWSKVLRGTIWGRFLAYVTHPHRWKIREDKG